MLPFHRNRDAVRSLLDSGAPAGPYGTGLVSWSEPATGTVLTFHRPASGGCSADRARLDERHLLGVNNVEACHDCFDAAYLLDWVPALSAWSLAHQATSAVRQLDNTPGVLERPAEIHGIRFFRAVRHLSRLGSIFSDIPYTHGRLLTVPGSNAPWAGVGESVRDLIDVTGDPDAVTLLAHAGAALEEARAAWTPFVESRWTVRAAEAGWFGKARWNDPEGPLWYVRTGMHVRGVWQPVGRDELTATLALLAAPVVASTGSMVLLETTSLLLREMIGGVSFGNAVTPVDPSASTSVLRDALTVYDAAGDVTFAETVAALAATAA